MFTSTVVLALVLWQAAPTAPAPPSQPAQASMAVADNIAGVKRIYVESFGEDPVAKQVQSFVIASLTDSKRFKVTENKDKADAILRGSAMETTSQEKHSYATETGVAAVAGAFGGGVGSIAGTATGIGDANSHTETIDHARISVRLVNQDGDVIWAASKESRGGKYKGASADVADQVVKQLFRDLEKLDKPTQPASTATK